MKSINQKHWSLITLIKTKFNNELATYKTEVQDAFDIITNILNENLNLSLDEHTALNNINIKY